MIARIWHGWTKPENADEYESLLKNKVFPDIAAKKVRGYKEIQLLRSVLKNEVEFITIMRFENRDAVKKFAGEDYRQAYVPPEARKILSRFDEKACHYEIKMKLKY